MYVSRKVVVSGCGDVDENDIMCMSFALNQCMLDSVDQRMILSSSCQILEKIP